MSRLLVIAAGVGVVAAATHANVVRAGGYGADDAPLIIAIAILLALGMGYVGSAFADGRRAAAALLGVCILAGEAYWVLLNSEREIASREALAAPSREVAAKHERAAKRVQDAEAAKLAADAAVVSQAARQGCARNCAKLLAETRDRAAAHLEAARAALEALPVPRSLAPLPERLGIAPWLWDLLMAGLRSLAVVGGSIAIGMAAHPPRASPPKSAAAAPGGATAGELLPAPTYPPEEPREHVARFLHSVLTLSPAELGRELGIIVNALGLRCVQDGRDVVVYGARLI
jgi:hypothetical protein